MIVHVQRQVGGKRLMTQISEVRPMGEDGYYRIADIFRLESQLDETGGKTVTLNATGEKSHLAGHLDKYLEDQVTEHTAEIFGMA